MANEAQMIFASSTTCIDQVITVSDTYVVGGDTELDNSTNLYPLATAVINIPGTFGIAPTGPIDLYMVRGDVDGTADGTALGYAVLDNDDTITDSTYAEYMGSWQPDVDQAYRDTINISLNGVQKAKFYIQNRTGTTLVYTTNITVKIAPFTYVPA